MNGRELSEMAAKAANVKIIPYVNPLSGGIAFRVMNGSIPVSWNPIKDDGDCARLETAVGIGIEWHEAMVTAIFTNNRKIISKVELFEDHGGDKSKARRYASTRCAAEIGRSM